MGKLFGGSQSTSTEVPQWLEDAARVNLARADEISSIGYVPYYGPDVAAFTPSQQAAFANTGQAAGAFGLPGGGLIGTEGIPQPQQFAGGISGYSSAPLYQQSVDALSANRPGQYDFMTGMFINPFTGAAPRGPFGNAALTSPIEAGIVPTSLFGGGDPDGVAGFGNDGRGDSGGLAADFGDMASGAIGFDPFGGGFE